MANWYDPTPEPENGRRPFTRDDLFFFTNDPEYSDYHKGIECEECGAAVIDTDKHVQWHNKVADL